VSEPDARAAVAPAAISDATAARRRALNRSLSNRIALASDPMTNPSCTASVSQVTCHGGSESSRVIGSATTVAANHGAMESTMATERMPSCPRAPRTPVMRRPAPARVVSRSRRCADEAPGEVRVARNALRHCRDA
jgi:hypothetical protein